MRAEITVCAKSVRYNIFTNGAPYGWARATKAGRLGWFAVGHTVDLKSSFCGLSSLMFGVILFLIIFILVRF